MCCPWYIALLQLGMPWFAKSILGLAGGSLPLHGLVTEIIERDFGCNEHAGVPDWHPQAWDCSIQADSGQQLGSLVPQPCQQGKPDVFQTSSAMPVSFPASPHREKNLGLIIWCSVTGTLLLLPDDNGLEQALPHCQEYFCLCSNRLCSPANPSGSSVAKRSNLSGLHASFQPEMSSLRHNLLFS